MSTQELKYKGIKMRSLLETRIAYLLDKLEIKWQYEPEKFYLEKPSKGYIPDFYLPKQEMWIEGKGQYKEQDQVKVTEFARQENADIMLLKSDKAFFITKTPQNDEQKSESINLVKCSKCESFCFVSDLASYECRSCGFHNGDNDIVRYDIFGEGHWITEKPELFIKDRETIDNWFKKVKK